MLCSCDHVTPYVVTQHVKVLLLDPISILHFTILHQLVVLSANLPVFPDTDLR